MRRRDPSPFEAARRILCGPSRREPSAVEPKTADVSLLDELAALDAATARDAFDRMREASSAGEEIDPTGDLHASAAFKRHLARVLTVRALKRAVERAGEARA